MPTNPLIKTKLTIPRPRANLVARPRLVGRLNQVTCHRLTLISAAPGFGKTTLLVEWQAARGDQALPMAWLSLDEGDNDPVRFVAYLAAACRSLAGRGPASPPRRSSPPLAVVDSTLVTLINDLASVPADAVLVLDDYHTICAPQVHDAVTLLLNRLPPEVHVIIVTRTDPPLPVAQLRAADQLLELRTAELSFTPAEAGCFLREVMRLTLTADQVQALYQRTEGWITGLQLAGLALQGSGDVDGFVRNFAGSHRFVLDYFGEVFRRQSPAAQEFMLRTAVLDNLNAELCKAVTGNAESQAALEEMERTNLFIVPLDGTRTWYRYHSLFSEFLRSSLQQLHPEWIADLHRSASAWYAANDLAFQAIDHALVAGDFEQAGLWIEQAVPGVLMRCEMVTMSRWLGALPDAVINSRPRLSLMHALGLALTWRFDAIEDCLQRVEHDVSSESEETEPDRRVMLGVSAALRMGIAAIHGDLSRIEDLCRETLEQLPEGDAVLQGLGLWTLGLAHFFRGEPDAARQAMMQVIASSQPGMNVMLTMVAVYTLGYLEVAQGCLHQAQQIYRRGLQLATGEDGHIVPVAGLAYLGLGELAHEWNQLDEALRLFEQALELSKGWENLELVVDAYLGIARTKLSLGDLDGVSAALKELDQVSRQSVLAPRDVVEIAACHALLALARGDLASAAQRAEELAARTTCKGPLPLVLHLYLGRDVALVRVFLARNELDRAQALLDQRIDQANEAGQVGNIIKITVLQALVLQETGDLTRAEVVLEQALASAEPEEYCRAFVDEGEPMRGLITALRPRLTGSLYVYADRLLSAFGLPEVVRATALPAEAGPELVESLSEREIEVLNLLAEGLSSPQIAKQLVIAVSTVRSHLKNIYGKLEVDNRVQAVERGRKLGLIP